MQTKYVAAIENKNTPDVGQLETGAPARFAGMGQLIDLTTFARRSRARWARRRPTWPPVTMVGGKIYALPWYIMPAFWYVWRDVFEKNKVKLPTTFEEAKAGRRRAEPAQGQLLRHGPELEPHRRRLRRHAEPDVLLRRRAGRTRTASTSRSRRPRCRTVMKWATDIYKDGIQPADTLTWTGSRQQRELHRQEHRADLQRPQHHLRPGERGRQGHRRQGARRRARRRWPTTWPCRIRPVPTAAACGPSRMSFGIFKTSKDPEAAMSLIAHLLSPEETVRGHEGLLRPVRPGARQGARGLEGLLQQERELPDVRTRRRVVRAHRAGRAPSPRRPPRCRRATCSPTRRPRSSSTSGRSIRPSSGRTRRSRKSTTRCVGAPTVGRVRAHASGDAHDTGRPDGAPVPAAAVRPRRRPDRLSVLPRGLAVASPTSSWATPSAASACATTSTSPTTTPSARWCATASSSRWPRWRSRS